jgi:hypothetical protein
MLLDSTFVFEYIIFFLMFLKMVVLFHVTNSRIYKFQLLHMLPAANFCYAESFSTLEVSEGILQCHIMVSVCTSLITNGVEDVYFLPLVNLC